MQFLVQFAQEHSTFRLQELLSVSSLFGIDFKSPPSAYSELSPFLIVDLPSVDAAVKLTSRCVLVKAIHKLLGVGKDYNELQLSVSSLSASEMEPYINATFKIIMDSFNKKCSLRRQAVILERLSFLPFQGKVNLSNPDYTFYVMEDYGIDHNNTGDEPERVFFCSLVAHGQRNLLHQYSVKNRVFIGNTSMDACLSFLMANQAKITNGDVICDPFVGTGSILVACAHFGGYVIGADINQQLLHGKGRPSRSGTNQKWRSPDESVMANLKQYGLERFYIDVLVSDAAKVVWRSGDLFDAIITDPPYGIREGARKLGSKLEEAKPISIDQLQGHIPSVRHYQLTDVYDDLLQFAAKFLVLNGRLVYWLPIDRSQFDNSLVPSHPCLQLVSTSEQILHANIARLLITMVKTTHYCHSTKEGGHSSNVINQFRINYFK